MLHWRSTTNRRLRPCLRRWLTAVQPCGRWEFFNGLLVMIAGALMCSSLEARVVEIRVFELPELRTQFHPSEFFPDLVIVDAGDTVRWVWQAGEHTITSGDFDLCLADSVLNIPIGEKAPVYQRRFDEPGVFRYFCDLHCYRAMYGAVAVLAPPATKASTWGRIKTRFRR